MSSKQVVIECPEVCESLIIDKDGRVAGAWLQSSDASSHKEEPEGVIIST